MKKLICAAICLVFAFCLFSACRKDGEDQGIETTAATETTEAVLKEKEISLGYFKEKGLNPYKTESPLNRSLLTLVYDSLFVIDDGYKASPLIAESLTREEDKLIVKIKDELLFSDGSVVDSTDVVYSFKIAKESAFYSQRLINIKTATASDDSVIFTLDREDIFAECCLTFPIIRVGDGGEKIPVGSGRYTLSKKGDGYFLKANESTTRAEEMTTDKINLVPVSAEKGELYLLQTGALTYFFDDLSDGEYTKIAANMVKLPLNNLVYIGFNNNGIFSDDKLRQAVSLSLDKTAICDKIYEGMYREPRSVFNPDWYAAEALEMTTDSTDINKAEELLENSGYVYAYSHNAFRSKNFEFLKVRLLVCSDTEVKTSLAKEIKNALEEIGISVEVDFCDYESYCSALKKGEFDLYVGEIKLSPNMSLMPFFKKGAGASYGIDTAGVTSKAYFDFIKGAVDISTFAQVFESSLPFIPLCYRDGMAYYSRELSYEGEINEFEPFKNFYSWEV